MTIRPIFNDINSKINLGALQNEITRTDILIAINDAIAAIRGEYVNSGLGQSFSVTEQVTSLARDTSYPFTFVGTLANEVIKRSPLNKGILSISTYKTNTELTNTSMTATVGTFAYKNTADEFTLYRCVESFTDTNTFTATFEKTQIRQWRSENGLLYYTDEVVFDGTSYWKLLADLDNTLPYTFTAGSPGAGEIQATKMYWISEGDATTNPVFYEFDRINELRLFNRDGYVGYTVKNNKIHTTFGIQKFDITYVPEWTYLDNLDTDAKLTYEMGELVKRRALAGLAIKFPRLEQEQQ